MERRKCLLVVGILFLCFFGIPIRINKIPSKDEKTLFENYIKKFNKTYNENDTEYVSRFENFKISLKLVEKLNQNRSNNESALYGLTVFSDLSQDEFIENRLQMNNTLTNETSEINTLQNMLYTKKFKSIHSNNRKNFVKRSMKLPAKVDWREKGIIGRVHNQKNCGACWAFSTIGTIEAMNALKVGSLTELSVQEAIDCAKNGNYGCEGGNSCSLLDWLYSTKAKITSEKLYPFIYQTKVCETDKLKTGIQIQNFTCDNFVGNEDVLLQRLAFHGPVAADVNALNWQYYLGGVIQFHCPGAPQNLNHAIQIVGYDMTGTIPYYIIRNSWGTEFGDRGYVYVAIGKNVCGVANKVTSLNVK